MVEHRPFLNILTHAVLIAGVVVVIFPVYLAVIASRHPPTAFSRDMIPVLPGNQALENYSAMLGQSVSPSGAPPCTASGS